MGHCDQGKKTQLFFNNSVKCDLVYIYLSASSA